MAASIHKRPQSVYKRYCPTVAPGSSWITIGTPVLNKHAKPGVIKSQLQFTCTNLLILMSEEFQRQAMQIIQASVKPHLHPNNTETLFCFYDGK